METRIIPVGWTLLCVVLSSVGALEVTIPQPEFEKARGDNISLPCTFKPKNVLPDLVIISWSVEGVQAGAKETLILTHYSSSKKTDIKSEYEGRASLDVNVPKGKADLLLKSITLADNKIFECRVQIPGDDEGKPSATTRLIVLVAPSTPICAIQGKAEYGQNINLTCHSEEGSPAPEYTWRDRDVRNKTRVGAPRVPPKGAILPLLNISKDTSGFYTCISSNKIRSATCNITLSVMPPSMNIGSTAGIIAGVVALLVILIVVVYCCCCKKKEKEEDYAMGVRKDEYSDKEPDENRRPEVVRSNEDSEVRSAGDKRDQYEDRSERDYDRRNDYDDRRSDYDDRRSDYNDRRSDYNDRRSDYNDRRSDYDDRRSDYDDRRNDYDDRRNDYDDRSDRRERYDDDPRYEDERRTDDRRDYADDRYDEPYDGKPAVPTDKPRRD